MRRVIRKSIRRKEEGLDLAVDFNADIVINTGSSRPAATTEGEAEGRGRREDPARTEETDQEREDS